jgi:IS1 family transposase
MTGVSKPTILKLLLDIGRACTAYEDLALRNLQCARIECDELWGFCGAKDRNIRRERMYDGLGSVWTWIALDPDSKLIVSWIMGGRDGAHASAFMYELADRLDNQRIQLSTDGWQAYNNAVVKAFGRYGVDYAQVTKIFEAAARDEARYSPPKCVGCERKRVLGLPLKSLATTSHSERLNLSVRMNQRRWTRLTNAHSKSRCHMEAAFALHAFHYNFIRKHMAHGKTPAMAAGVADHPWTMEELVELLEWHELLPHQRRRADGNVRRLNG